MKTKTYNFLCLIVFVLTLYFINGSSPATTPPPSPSCVTTCGGVAIPFPFGIGEKECYLNRWYEVVCNSTTSGSSVTTTTTVPYLSRINKEVVNISLPDYNAPYSVSYNIYGLVHIKGPVTSLSCSTSPVSESSSTVLNVTGKGSPYFITDENRLVAVGCGTKGSLTNIESEILGCESSCEDSKRIQQVTNTICNGYNCCQARIPLDRPRDLGVSIESSNDSREGCKVAFLTSQRYSPVNVTEPEQFLSDGYVVVELGWYFDASDSRSSRVPSGCKDYTNFGSYTMEDSCLCELGDFFDMSYSNAIAAVAT